MEDGEGGTAPIEDLFAGIFETLSVSTKCCIARKSSENGKLKKAMSKPFLPSEVQMKAILDFLAWILRVPAPGGENDVLRGSGKGRRLWRSRLKKKPLRR
jgi:hypothetical protein